MRPPGRAEGHGWDDVRGRRQGRQRRETGHHELDSGCSVEAAQSSGRRGRESSETPEPPGKMGVTARCHSESVSCQSPQNFQSPRFAVMEVRP